MSSNVESVQLNEETNDMADLVELSDEDNVQLNEEANDMADEILDNEGGGSKRKSSSGAWSHFTTVEVQEDGKMVKKHECMHCKKKVCKVLEVFLDALRDSNFEWSLTDDEWNRAQKVCKVLEVFLDATNLFSGTSYPTTNLFLVEIFKVKKEISSCYISNDGFLKKMSEPMFEKFEKYWGKLGFLWQLPQF
ncbi:putative transcription factor/ chromatin remodeling BED-type(Zn) family [Helianthus annuus]|nr:putative transcription factor/ chromatin remodeling BED-type(Zn) family [Helianthus annuus]